MSRLDENQEKAANHFCGPALVLAGPGSGKTAVLTERTFRLGQKISSPERILCVTFTNAAALEMKKRYVTKYQEYVGEICGTKPVFKTVHSLCNYLLREYERRVGKNFNRLTSEIEIGKIINAIYAEINGNEATESIMKYILQFKNQRKNEADVKNIKLVLEKYDLYKREKNIIDFDDMISYTCKILNSKEDIDVRFKEYVTEKFDFIQIDEAQDLTREQFDVLEKICKTDNIFVVADDDQSIYGFRGAEPKNLILFKNKHKSCTIYHLSRNYRSCSNIVNFSKNIINKNINRFEKNLYTLNDFGAIPKILAFKNAVKQGEFIFKEIRRLRKMESDLSIGILFRNNFSGIIPGVILAGNNVIYEKASGCIFTREISCVERLMKMIRQEERSHIFIPTPEKTFRRLIESGFEKNVASVCKAEGREKVYKEFILLFFDYLCKISNDVNEMIKIMENMDCGSSSDICLSTIHSSKGLEFDAVFVIDMIMGLFPGKNTMEINSIEEERRLFYVAATRAKRYLYITYPLEGGNNILKGSVFDKSIFIEEIDK